MFFTFMVITCELYTRPQNTFVASFIGSPKMNMLPATVKGGKAALPDFGEIDLGSNSADGEISVGVRPEQFEIGAGGDHTAHGEITLVEYLGSEMYVHARLPSGRPVMVRAAGKAGHRIGEKIGLSIAPENAHYFGADGKRLPVFD